MIQAASDAGNAAGLVYFIFDLLHLDGEDIAARPLIERKASLSLLLSAVAPPPHYSDYHRGRNRQTLLWWQGKSSTSELNLYGAGRPTTAKGGRSGGTRFMLG